MKTIREVCELTGLTARALHHYDSIGLLTPTVLTEGGYRLYGEDKLERLQAILLFRELEFPLKDIKNILDDPGFDPKEALERQIKLLELKAAHLKRLAKQARKLQKGEDIMDLQAFRHEEIDQYAQEVKERWGKTAAFEAFQEKTKGKDRGEMEEAGSGLEEILKQLGALRGEAPSCAEAQRKIEELQRFITLHYYQCTNEILAGLGEMYVADERMRKNIDKAGGEGTAAFTAQAIAAYVKEK